MMRNAEKPVTSIWTRFGDYDGRTRLVNRRLARLVDVFERLAAPSVATPPTAARPGGGRVRREIRPGPVAEPVEGFERKRGSAAEQLTVASPPSPPGPESGRVRREIGRLESAATERSERCCCYRRRPRAAAVSPPASGGAKAFRVRRPVGPLVTWLVDVFERRAAAAETVVVAPTSASGSAENGRGVPRGTLRLGSAAEPVDGFARRRLAAEPVAVATPRTTSGEAERRGRVRRPVGPAETREPPARACEEANAVVPFGRTARLLGKFERLRNGLTRGREDPYLVLRCDDDDCPFWCHVVVVQGSSTLPAEVLAVPPARVRVGGKTYVRQTCHDVRCTAWFI